MLFCSTWPFTLNKDKTCYLKRGAVVVCFSMGLQHGFTNNSIKPSNVLLIVVMKFCIFWMDFSLACYRCISLFALLASAGQRSHQHEHTTTALCGFMMVKRVFRNTNTG